MSINLADGLEAKVDRFGEHHVWTGSKKTNGSGKLKVGGRSLTARRAAEASLRGVLLGSWCTARLLKAWK